MARLKSKGFYTVAGRRVPSVTTVIGTNLGWDKQVLIGWARKEAMAGRDPYKVRDEAGSIGTLTHLMIQRQIMPAHEHPFQINFEEWTGEQRAAAERGLAGFNEWLARWEHVETQATELSLVSERWLFGGTLDWVVKLNGEPCYVDFKTSRGLYPGHMIQVSAYLKLFHEHQRVWLTPHVLRLGKDDGSFHHHPLTNLTEYWRVFQHLLALHQYKQRIDP